MSKIYIQLGIRVTIFSTGGKFQPVWNFTYLHTLPLAARSYVLLGKLRTHDMVEGLTPLTILTT